MTWVLRIWALVAVAFAVAAGAQPAAGQSSGVLVTRVDGVITPVVADHLGDAVAAAVDRGSQALLVELDTPGGLDPAMRAIVRDFLGSRVPIIVYVEPSGARAASAGAIITMAAHVAAMAPGTTIGAATPVNAQTGEPAGDKIINDFSAYARSIAGLRERDQQFADDAVRQGKAVTAGQALELGVIDVVAASRAELLQAVDGRTVALADGTTVTLQQGGEIGFAETFRLAFAASMDHDPVEHPAAPAGPVADQPGDRDTARALAGDRDNGGLAARGPGAGLGWSQRVPTLVGEDDPRAQPARDPFTAGH
ncbi:hypothetical protein [Catellatospora coxensis]|uniref:NfeD1b N-terminal domain-containing protein n=1 Tax=Catellatospora coxensis TaxID=310354 RepID=A0A8J3KME1_9ACTN|nr:hypothetical protein [Catellatospora coxensis]GIG05667.1 hypothetical protein Cco03nite_23670 [Catellatospora coxensis]